MKKLFYIFLIFFIAILVIVAYQLRKKPNQNNNLSASAECSIQSPDKDGYLEKICIYIRKNKINVSPAKPDQYAIKSIAEGTYQNKQAIMVNLNCCYLGDRAYIDPLTKEVVGFSVGPK